MKLFCDEMLIKLGRWLRVAGYDTRIARQGMSDRQIMQLAREENRCLITRDSNFEMPLQWWCYWNAN